MTINDYAYEIMELIYRNLTDDIEIDIRLVKDIIVEQREIDIYRKLSSYKYTLPYSQFKSYVQDIESVFVESAEPSLNDCVTINKWLVSKDKFDFVEYMGSPAIFYIKKANTGTINPSYLIDKIHFTTSDRAVNVGNGRFNNNQKLAFYENGNVIITTKDTNYIDSNNNGSFLISGILKDPRKVNGFDDDTSEFPIGSGWGYYKQFVIQSLINKIKGPEDVLNDATDEKISNTK